MNLFTHDMHLYTYVQVNVHARGLPNKTMVNTRISTHTGAHIPTRVHVCVDGTQSVHVRCGWVSVR